LLGRFCARTAFWFFIAFTLFVCAVFAGLKYGLMPNLAAYEADLQRRVSEATGMDVAATSIRGGWSGFSPFLEMEGVEFREPSRVTSAKRTPGEIALKLPLVRASLSIPYLVFGQPRFSELYVVRPELSLRRAADGYIYFAGRALNRPNRETDDGRLLNWLLDQPSIEIHQASLTWQDDTTPAPALTFSDVGIHIEKSLGRHILGAVATPPHALATKVELRGRVRIEQDDGYWRIEGSAYAAAVDANLGELRRHLNVPDNWQSGVGTVRTWVDLDNAALVGRAKNSEAKVDNTASFINPVAAVVADVHIINARAQLGDDAAPLNIAKLAGRLEYKRLDGGFQVGSKKLEFSTREGVVSPAADFSVALRNAGLPSEPNRASGEITANGIDLKVVTSLVEYFPIGRELRQLAAKFGLRGEVKAARFAWTGPVAKPITYQVKGTLANFAANANDRIPGVSGFSGSVEGSEKGGRFTVAAKTMAIDAPVMFREVLVFDAVDGRGNWAVSAKDVEVGFDQLKFTNKDLTAELTGKVVRPRVVDGVVLPIEKQAGTLDVTLKVGRVAATRIPGYLPNGMAKSREFLEWALRDGRLENIDLSIIGDVYQFPYHNGVGGKFSTTANLVDVDLRYAENWPPVNDINATLTLDNTAIRASIGSARIFSARVRKTEINFPDVYVKPFLLSIIGEADARAEDVSRFLRESPMVDGVGAFTRYLALDGPGKLNINLTLPLAVTPETVAQSGKPAPKLELSGRYSLLRGGAKLNIGPAISNLSGSINFTQSSVKSSAIVGSAFGSPLNVNITGGGEAGVVTEFVARADVQQLGDLIPFRMPSQVVGTSDVIGRLTSTAAGLEIAVDASLVGVTSTLPSPLAKRADEARRLRLTMSAVGQTNERIRVTLAGGAVDGDGRSAGASENPESRIEARFQRRFDAGGVSQFYGGLASVGMPVSEISIPEGLWLAGKMRQLDFDEWVRAVARFYPREKSAGVGGAGAAASRESPIAGFDFALGRLVAYGRPFADLTIRGRQSTDRSNPTWAMSVASKDAEGDFTWRPSANNERGAVRARLKRLVIAEEVAADTAPVQTATTVATSSEQELPALDILADEFTFKDRWLGKLELRATPQIDNWRIDQLLISNGHARADMNGSWLRYGDPFAPPRAGLVKSLTKMNMKVESNNLNALFNQFGFGDYMRGGRGSLEGTLSWPGHVYQYQAASLSGAFRVEAEKGQFAKIPAGAGKLLGLISLQSIPRRLSFDFRDLFSEGFAFDKIDGDLSITDGIMFAKKFEISGPAADVKMVGDVSLPTERQNLTMTVAPRLSGVAAVGAGLLVNPLVGLGVLLGGEALKNPIERVLAVQYSVTGTWDNPQVERTGRVTAPVEPAKGANAATTENSRVNPTPPTAAPGKQVDEPNKKKAL
jgi:uncharacterized protein (TIGR02099 family)